MAGARHGMCELTRHGIAGERHGNSMGAAWARHGMCELAFIGKSRPLMFWVYLMMDYQAETCWIDTGMNVCAAIDLL
jgi:hypothetical protein